MVVAEEEAVPEVPHKETNKDVDDHEHVVQTTKSQFKQRNS